MLSWVLCLFKLTRDKIDIHRDKIREAIAELLSHLMLRCPQIKTPEVHLDRLGCSEEPTESLNM